MTSPAPSLVVVTTVIDDRPAADRFARTLVERNVAACAQVSGPITSTYRWDGAVTTSEEWRIDCKSTPARADALVSAILELHSYDVPEVLVTPVIGGNPAYAAWAADEVTPV